MDLTKEKMVDLYRNMCRMRNFEEIAVREFKAGKLQGFLHVGVGEEATIAGVLAQARASDFTNATHRGHGAVLLKGADPKLMYAELAGRRAGLCKGRGGSMHMADLSKGILGTNGILGAGAPIAMGVGLGIQYTDRDDVAFCFFGDGQSNEGGVHEAMNMAAAMKLPVVFICTNNQYGMWTSLERASANVNLADRAVGYGMPGVSIDGNDVLAVYEASTEAIARARRGEGPSMLELKTYRYYGHSVGLNDPWRDQAEIDDWRKNRDPIDRFRKVLAESHGLEDAQMDEIFEQSFAEMEEAFAWAMEQPFPEESDAHEDVYTNLAVRGRTV